MSVSTQQQSADFRALTERVNGDAAAVQRVTQQVDGFARQMEELRVNTEQFQHTATNSATSYLEFQRNLTEVIHNSLRDFRAEGEQRQQQLSQQVAADLTRANENANFQINTAAEGLRRDLQLVRNDMDERMQGLRRDIQAEVAGAATIGTGRDASNHAHATDRRATDENREEMFAINEIVKKIPDVTLTADGVNSFVATVDLLSELVNEGSDRDVRKFDTSIRLKLVGCSLALRNAIRDQSWAEMRTHLLNAYCFSNTANDTQNKINTLAQKSKENLFDYGTRARQLLIKMSNHVGIDANEGMSGLIEKGVKKSFIRGLSDHKLRERLRAMPCRDLSELLDSAVEQSEYLSDRTSDSRDGRRSRSDRGDHNGTRDRDRRDGDRRDRGRRDRNRYNEGRRENNGNRGSNGGEGGARNRDNRNNSSRGGNGNGANGGNNNAGRGGAYPMAMQGQPSANLNGAQGAPCAHQSQSNHLN